MSWYSPFSYFDIAQLYLSAPYLWDTIIYLCIFLGLASYVFTSTSNFGKKGKPVAIGLGLALTLSMVMWTYNNGWNLGSAQLAILPLTVLGLVFFVFLYRVLHDFLGLPRHCSFAISYLFVYSGVSAMYANPLQNAFTRAPTIEVLLAITMLIAIGTLIWCFISIFPKSNSDDSTSGGNGGGDGGGRNGGGGGNGGGDTPPRGPHTLEGAINDFVRAVGDLPQLKTRYRQALNNALAANHAHHTAPTPDTRTQKTNTLRAMGRVYQQLSASLQTIEQLSRAISTHPEVGSVPENLHERFGTAYNAYFRDIRDIAYLRGQFRDLIRRNDGGPIP